MARTNIDLNRSLLSQALRLTGLRTKRAVVHKALEVLVHRERRRGLLALEGKVRWRGSLSRMRRGRGAPR